MPCEVCKTRERHETMQLNNIYMKSLRAFDFLRSQRTTSKMVVKSTNKVYRATLCTLTQFFTRKGTSKGHNSHVFLTSFYVSSKANMLVCVGIGQGKHITVTRGERKSANLLQKAKSCSKVMVTSHKKVFGCRWQVVKFET